MANEAKLIIETEIPIMMTCADGTGIEKGALLKLSDPFTAATSDGSNDYPAGIAAEEKIASDGKTKIAVYRRGVFKVITSGAITAGCPASIDAATNHIQAADASVSGAKVLGTALETAADGETLLMELNMFSTGQIS